MTKTPWTPGPWALDIPTDTWMFVTGDGYTIARIIDGMPSGQYHANANLIAEAPAMAEALEVLAHWFNQSEERRLDTIATARAILARIKGEPQ